MPIVFQQPSPVSPPISAAAGAAEQFDRFAPVLQRQQESLANQYMQMQALGQRAASDQADRSQRGGEFSAQMDARANAEQVQAGQHQADLQARAQMQQVQQEHESQQQEQRFRLMQEAATAELTQREKVEMSRLQMAAGAVRDNPNLDEQEKNDLLTQIYTKIDPLQQRKARAQIQQDQLENQALEQKLGKQHRMEAEHAQFIAGTLKATTVDLNDGQGNYLSSAIVIPGVEKPHFVDKREQQAAAQARVDAAQLRADAKEATGQRKHDEAVTKHQHQVGQEYVKIEEHVDRQVAQERKAAEHPEQTDWDKRAENLKILRKRAYLEGNPPPQKPGSTSNIGGQDQPRPDRKPITPDNPPSPVQEKELAVFGAARSVFATVPRDRGRMHPEEAEAKTALDDAEKLYRKYGDSENMPPDTRAAYLDAIEKARLAAKKFRDRVTAPAPPPVTPNPNVGDRTRGFMNVPRF